MDQSKTHLRCHLRSNRDEESYILRGGTLKISSKLMFLQSLQRWSRSGGVESGSMAGKARLLAQDHQRQSAMAKTTPSVIQRNSPNRTISIPLTWCCLVIAGGWCLRERAKDELCRVPTIGRYPCSNMHLPYSLAPTAASSAQLFSIS
jgi:hypothetical protein